MSTYHSMFDIAKEHKWLRHDIYKWHLCVPTDGYIHGIEKLCGTLIALNGNLGLLQRENEIILVHANNFVPYGKWPADMERTPVQKPTKRDRKIAPAPQQDVDALLAHFGIL